MTRDRRNPSGPVGGSALPSPLSGGFGDRPAAAGSRRLPLAPSEGWLTLLLVLVMVVCATWAVDDARWVGVGAGGRSQTEFLPWAALLGGLWGFAAAKSSMGALTAHLLGAGLGAAAIIVWTAGALSASPDLPVRIRALTDSLDRFYFDLFWERIRSAETSAFLITTGAIAWATGHFASFVVFRRRRPLAAVFVAGAVLLTNMSVTLKIQYPFLVVFAAAALLLIVRMNLLEQRSGWIRRRIGDAGYVSGLYMRSGLAFVTVAMVGSLVLTATASSAPLSGAWRDVDSQLVSVGNQINHVLGGITGPARGPSGLFGSNQTIRGVWESSSVPVFRAEASDRRGHYWRAAAYDYFDGRGWQQLESRDAVRIAPGDELLEPTRDRVDPDGRHEVQVTVTADTLLTDTLLSPDAPLVVDRTADVYTHRPNGPFAGIRFPDRLARGDTYSLVALVRNEGQGEGALDQAKLIADAPLYDAWAERYARIREGTIGPVTYATTQRIVDRLPANQRTPYHIAAAIQEYLYSRGGFRYQTDVRGVCDGRLLLDCFLETKVGYCEYFATAMTMMLRTQGIPARYVLGYLPGKPVGDGAFQVDQGAAHAWVEVLFPSYGWVRFDPTPGNQENGQRPTRLQQGEPEPSPSASGAPARPSFRDPRDDDDLGADDEPTRSPGVGAAPTIGEDGPGSGGILAGLLAVLLLGAAAVVLWSRRRVSVLPEPDIVYRGVTRIATRLGYGPRPTQTAYEYAGALGEVLPSVRSELTMVATAKVESAYANRPPRRDALHALADAYRRIRNGLLRLAIRQPVRRLGSVRRRPPRR